MFPAITSSGFSSSLRQRLVQPWAPGGSLVTLSRLGVLVGGTLLATLLGPPVEAMPPEPTPSFAPVSIGAQNASVALGEAIASDHSAAPDPTHPAASLKQSDKQSDKQSEATEPAPPLDPPDAAEPDDAIPVFGTRGTQRLYIQGAAATTWDDDDARRFGLAGAGYSHFFVPGHSINAELNGMAFDQTGDDAVGLNLAVLMRWHFVRQSNWSLYVDGGAGILATTDDVPSAGSSFNFTPQVGAGATIKLADEKRLMLGLRWHHISNANTFESNPGRDSVMGYVGVNLPR